MRRTTIALDERVYERVKARARKEHKHFQDCANELLILGLRTSSRKPTAPKPLPVYDMGAPLVDVADRDALFDAIERE